MAAQHHIMYLPLMGMISCVISIAAIIIVAFFSREKYSKYDGPALSKQDYVPVLYVATATLALLYFFYWNQSYTTFKEYFRLQEEEHSKRKKDSEKVILDSFFFVNSSSFLVIICSLLLLLMS